MVFSLRKDKQEIGKAIKDSVNQAFNTECDDKVTDRIHSKFYQYDVDVDVIEVEVSDPTVETEVII